MQITYETETGEESVSDVADVMVVGPTLRYVTFDKEMTAVSGGSLRKILADRDFNLGYNVEGSTDKWTLKDARFAAVSGGNLFASGKGLMAKVPGGTLGRARYVRL